MDLGEPSVNVAAEVGNHVISAVRKRRNHQHAPSRPSIPPIQRIVRTVDLLMATPWLGRQVAVVPFTESTLRLAERLERL